MRTRNLQLKRAVLFVLLLTLVGMTNVFSQEFTVGKLKYSVLLNPKLMDKCIWVTGHVDGVEAKGNIVIPDKVSWEGKEYPVSGIWDAFGGCSGLTSVIIPTSVKTINDHSFEYCSGLTSITIPNSVEYIGSFAFCGCSGLTSITIPNSVETIGGCAFEDCTSLASITISNSVLKIYNNAFCNTKWYNEQPDGILYLSNCCLGYKGDKPCGNLKLKNSTRLIACNAFYECSDLTGALVIPDSVISIGIGAFQNCNGFSGSLIIPDNVSTIGSNAFEECIGFDGNLVIGKSVIEIGDFAFCNCRGFNGDLDLPNSLMKVGYGAFLNCGGLNGNITIDNSITKIEEGAFKGCDNIIISKVENNAVASLNTPKSTKGTNTIPRFARQGIDAQKLSVFHEGMAAYENSKGKWGYMDRSGKSVIPCIYQDARRFSEGLAAVQKDGHWGYINKNGETVIPFQYMNPYPFHEGLAFVFFNGKYSVIDKNGNVVFCLPQTNEGFLPYSEGWAIVKPTPYTSYYIDKQGERVTRDFIEARPFSEGLAAVCDKNNNQRWGFIDKTGKIVIPCQYKNVRPFREGLAAVDGGYIDKSGNWVIPPKYIETSSFENGFALVIKDRTTVCVINKSGKETYYYTNQYDNFNTIVGFSNGIAAVYNKGAMFSDCFWLTFNTKCKKLTKDGYSLMLSYMDKKYDPGKNLLELNGLANECLFRANEEDNLAVCYWNPKWNETSYFYLDGQGNRY